jgi:hypothetical protein
MKCTHSSVQAQAAMSANACAVYAEVDAGKLAIAGTPAECGGASICEHQREKEHMQGVLGGEHLPAPAHQEQMQGVRGGKHLPESALRRKHFQ